MQAYLIVHQDSVPFIRHTIDFLLAELGRHHQSVTYLTAEHALDEVQIPAPAIVYVIGERMAWAQRQPGCFYVYLNFSVVAMIGNPLRMSLDGVRLIRKKRRFLEQKLKLADVVLDYYPAQTRALQRVLDKPVLGFLPCSLPSEGMPLAPEAREFDLCFVGTSSPRRQRVLEAARAAGLVLSPAHGMDLEDAAARSRLTLNVHMQASNHLEVPRIVGSLSCATPVVTEYSHGLAEIFSTDCVFEGPARRLVGMARKLLADPDHLAQLQQRAQEGYHSYYRKACALLEQSARDIARRAEGMGRS